MSFWKYKYFVDVVESKSFTKAGKKNYVSQTAISQQISALEKNVGGKLLERGGGELVVTELGQVVYDKAKEILEANDQLMQAVEHFKEKYVIRIGIDSAINKRLWRCMQQMIDEYYSEEEFCFSKINYAIANKMLEEGSLDIYVGYGVEKFSKTLDIEEKEICRNPLGIYIGQKSSLLEREEWKVSTLDKYKRYCTHQYPCSVVKDTKEPFSKMHGSVRMVNNTETMKLKVEFNDGYAFVDSCFFSQCEGRILLLEDYQPPCIMKLFYRRERNKDKLKNVIDTICEVMTE